MSTPQLGADVGPWDGAGVGDLVGSAVNGEPVGIREGEVVMQQVAWHCDWTSSCIHAVVWKHSARSQFSWLSGSQAPGLAGTSDGYAVGNAVGSDVGFAVGIGVGAAVGAAVGGSELIGDRVGDTVGLWLSATSRTTSDTQRRPTVPVPTGMDPSGQCASQDCSIPATPDGASKKRVRE